jgi:hypothetical protein
MRNTTALERFSWGATSVTPTVRVGAWARHESTSAVRTTAVTIAPLSTRCEPVSGSLGRVGTS